MSWLAASLVLLSDRDLGNKARYTPILTQGAMRDGLTLQLPSQTFLYLLLLPCSE